MVVVMTVVVIVLAKEQQQQHPNQQHQHQQQQYLQHQRQRQQQQYLQRQQQQQQYQQQVLKQEQQLQQQEQQQQPQQQQQYLQQQQEQRQLQQQQYPHQQQQQESQQQEQYLQHQQEQQQQVLKQEQQLQQLIQQQKQYKQQQQQQSHPQQDQQHHHQQEQQQHHQQQQSHHQQDQQQQLPQQQKQKQQQYQQHQQEQQQQVLQQEQQLQQLIQQQKQYKQQQQQSHQQQQQQHQQQQSHQQQDQQHHHQQQKQQEHHEQQQHYEQQDQQFDLFSIMLSGLRELPFIGNVLKAAVHPLYRPFVNPFQPRIRTREGEEEDMEDNMRELCYGELGCLYTDEDFFHPIHRPINLPPNRREEVGVVFTVYTREDMMGTKVEALRSRFLSGTTFTSSRKTKVLIHGFLDHTGVTWMLDMLRSLLEAEDVNVITVDWSGGSQQLYSQATANTRLVALEVAHLINSLKAKLQLDPKHVHIIGHSLGAHTAGYVGQHVEGLGRITGLDPAEPFFQFMPPAVRLDPTDAIFVDVIHTDADSIFNLGTGFGLRQAVGHLDFYPNDGRSQPGCDSLTRIPLTALTDGLSLYEGLDAAQKEFVACHHNRAAKLFTESILSPCPYTAFHCSSYSQYLKGECTSCGDDGTHCARLGLPADNWPLSTRHNNITHLPLYLSTTAGPNFCLYHYLVRVDVAEDGGQATLRGHLKISFIKDDGTITQFDLSSYDPVTLTRGGHREFFLEHHEDFSSSTEALVDWTYQVDVFDPLSYCVIFCDTSLPLSTITVTSVDMIPSHRGRESSNQQQQQENNSNQQQENNSNQQQEENYSNQQQQQEENYSASAVGTPAGTDTLTADSTPFISNQSLLPPPAQHRSFRRPPVRLSFPPSSLLFNVM
ncbi:hypothetical protein Pcinc_024752 [Petrolisthes cinctipes]|uniref:Lipase domain-containing protein n=1 Tax=Petrolisthes cinctipes TaxID=88211 RepID=A0AAE1FBG0_PETCI|nr:hypothetical protein Pcinc_024752 [Petrolisthes cinctipes]